MEPCLDDTRPVIGWGLTNEGAGLMPHTRGIGPCAWAACLGPGLSQEQRHKLRHSLKIKGQSIWTLILHTNLKKTFLDDAVQYQKNIMYILINLCRPKHEEPSARYKRCKIEILAALLTPTKSESN